MIRARKEERASYKVVEKARPGFRVVVTGQIVPNGLWQVKKHAPSIPGLKNQKEPWDRDQLETRRGSLKPGNGSNWRGDLLEELDPAVQQLTWAVSEDESPHGDGHVDREGTLAALRVQGESEGVAVHVPEGLALFHLFDETFQTGFEASDGIRA